MHHLVLAFTIFVFFICFMYFNCVVFGCRRKANTSSTVEILSLFGHNLEYLSLRGEITPLLDLNECCDHLKALRICHNHDWITKKNNSNTSNNSTNSNSSGKQIPPSVQLNLPNSLQYLCLYNCSFDASILNQSFNFCKKLIHIALIECKWTNGTLLFPQSLVCSLLFFSL